MQNKWNNADLSEAFGIVAKVWTQSPEGGEADSALARAMSAIEEADDMLGEDEA